MALQAPRLRDSLSLTVVQVALRVMKSSEVLSFKAQVMFPGHFVLLEVVLVIVGICLPLVSYLSSYVSTHHPFLAGHMMWDGPNLGVYMLKGMLNGKRALAKSVHKQFCQYLWFFPKHIYWPYCLWTDLADYSSLVPV